MFFFFSHKCNSVVVCRYCRGLEKEKDSESERVVGEIAAKECDIRSGKVTATTTTTIIFLMLHCTHHPTRLRLLKLSCHSFPFYPFLSFSPSNTHLEGLMSPPLRYDTFTLFSHFIIFSAKIDLLYFCMYDVNDCPQNVVEK